MVYRLLKSEFASLHASSFKTDDSSCAKIARSRENVKITQELRCATIALPLQEDRNLLVGLPIDKMCLFFFNWSELQGPGRSHQVIEIVLAKQLWSS